MANCLRRYLCLTTVLLLVAFSLPLGAQSFTASVESYTSEVLTHQFNQYDVVKFDAKALETYVHSNAETPIQFHAHNHHWILNLTPNRLLSENYQEVVETSQGRTVTYPKLNIAFQGNEAKGGKTRLTIHGEFLYGYVEEGGERYYIEPLWYFEPFASRDLFVVYPRSAVNHTEEVSCGVTEEWVKLQHFDDGPDKNVQFTENDCYQVDLAIASDNSMINKYGSTGAVSDHNVAVINDVEGDYTGNFNHDLQFNIVTQYFPGGNDPWSASTDAGTVLDSFRAWGENNGFGVTYDIGELWTNRDFDGGTIGIAYLNGVCNSVKYHCLQDFSSDTDYLRCMTSHEIGHNFSAQHDGNCPPGNYIMCPFVSHSTEWSAASTTSINNYMQTKINSGCLSVCGPPPPPLVADFDWSVPACQGTVVHFTDLSSGNITGWNWVFQGGNPATSTQQNPNVTWNSPGQKNVTLTLSGTGGPSSITKVVDVMPLPVAGFTYSVNGLVVTFTNTSTNATSYEWDFGDGTLGYDTNPVHEYGTADTYTVILTASNECGTSTKAISVNTAPTADFSANPTTGCASLVVTMQNESSSNAVNFTWAFPGGAPSASNQANPTVVYAIAGTYTITLTASNSSGSNTITKTNYITVKSAPVANFNFTVNGATATFTNATLGNATSYLWDFGDNTTSTLANPVHTYANPGTYTVVLTATNECGSTTKSKPVEIVASAPPTASFTANPTLGCAPQTVTFTNTSTGAITYSWSFPGGNPSTSSATNPTVVYDNVGVYTVTLTASNPSGSSTATTTITVNTLPEPVFTYAVSNDTTYTFTNHSGGATSYLWIFGDGDSSTVADPIHNYPAVDSIINYQVILQATNNCGTVNDTQVVSVITNPHANFTATPKTGCAPLSVQFTNTSTPNATTFYWKFPGGVPDTSIVKNPVVVYNNPGLYTVTLIAINPSGRDTIVRTDYINVTTVPSAGFSSSANGLTVTFTNTTTNGTTYSWDFGDGGNSTDVNPVHTYATDGTYTVTLSASNNCGTVTKSQSVTVSTAPTAGFTVSTNSGCAALSVQVTNTSSNNATSFDWQFPGGNPSSSNQQNPPAVSYDLPGTYTITLTASNAAGSSTFTQTVVVNPGPTAGFSSTVSGLTATFANTSSNALTYSWDFGDGNSSSDANPTHDYAADGSYTVVLTVSNNCGSSSFTQTVVINTAPSSGFSENTTNGCAVLTVQFTDISSGNPVSWEWDFPGGTPSSSTDQNPTVQYFTAGSFDVTLVVTSAGGSTSSFTQHDVITVNGAPTVGFTSTANGNTVSFTNTSTNATSYIWNFGDGSQSAEENPTHTYSGDGDFSVTLTAINNCGSSIFQQTTTVSTPPVAGFNYNNNGCAPFTVQFDNTSSTNATSFHWDFPGGTPPTSVEENPTVVWTQAGTYTVTLTASNSAGSSTSTAVITVNPVALPSFTYQIGGLTAVFTNTTSNGTSYHWDFGDGNTSTDVNPTHTYSQAGNYQVQLTATNDCGTVTAIQVVIVQGAPPVPAITASNTSGCIPFTVQFFDQSAGDPTSWNWSFPGGVPPTSAQQNPVVLYNAPGAYDVTLQVGNAWGLNSQTFPGYITVAGPPVADFTYTANQTTVTFNTNTQNGATYIWSFGDGATSNEQNPVHTYAAPGTYKVILTVNNNCGTSIVEYAITLTSGTSEAAWIENFRLFPNPNPGLFTVEMNGLPQDKVEFTLYNALGQRIHSETEDFRAGAMVRQFHYPELAAGVYTLKVQADGAAKYFKLSIAR